MKTLTALAGAVALALAAVPARAGTILPAIYAKTFCELREMGASADDARAAAIQAAYIRADEWTYITIDGKQYKSDVILAARAAFERCPDLLK